MFQFTPLREGRLRKVNAEMEEWGFNSRPCVRGDRAQAVTRVFESGFQFTPLREGRLAEMCIKAATMMFQFTPLREGRQVPLLARKS